MASGGGISRQEVNSCIQRINDLKQTLPEAEIFNGSISSLHDILDITYQVWNTEGGISYTNNLKSYVDQLNFASEIESLNSQIKSATATATEEAHDDIIGSYNHFAD